MPSENNGVLTVEEVQAALGDTSVLSEDESRVAAKILPIIAGQANKLAEAHKAKELDKVVQELTASNKQLIEAELEKIRKQNQPPSPEDLEKLLSQEYVEFRVKIRERSGTGVEKEFIIRELPQATELKLFRSIQKSLVPHLKEISSVEWTASGNMASKLQRLIDTIPEAMDMLAENCATCLDPYEDQGITKEWVQKNLSSYRIMAIISAQVEAGKFRDFFSEVSRNIPSMTA